MTLANHQTIASISEGEVLPDGWKLTPLGELCTKLVDGSHNPPPKQTEGIAMLSARNVEDGRLVFDEFRRITKNAFNLEHGRTRIAPGDVLLTIVGSIGRATVVPELIEP